VLGRQVSHRRRNHPGLFDVHHTRREGIGRAGQFTVQDNGEFHLPARRARRDPMPLPQPRRRARRAQRDRDAPAVDLTNERQLQRGNPLSEHLHPMEVVYQHAIRPRPHRRRPAVLQRPVEHGQRLVHDQDATGQV
jgi:hypothetical protein